MNHSDPDPDLTARLRGLVEDIAVPDSDGRADLVRGRRRSYRRLTLILGGTTAACVAALAIGTGVVGGATGDEQALDPAVQPTPVTGASTVPGSVEPALHDPGCPAGEISLRVDTGGSVLTDQVAGYARTLARHLDPTGGHLQTKPTGMQTSATGPLPGRSGRAAAGKSTLDAECVRPGQVNGLGTKLDWRKPGDPGLGLVQIEVTSEQQGQIRMQMTGWKPVDAPGNAVRAWTAGSGDDLAVEIQRADGLYVAVAASGLFGNNSTVALRGGTGLTAAQLLQAAADPAYALP